MTTKDQQARDAFDYAHRNRLFEIEMFWKRSLVYWGFIAAAFVAFAALAAKGSRYSVVFCCFGFVCSVVWSIGNRGSKYWQEYWEIKVKDVQHAVTGDMFIDHKPKRHAWYEQFAPRRFSVSKLVMGLSDYSIVVWLALLIYGNWKLFAEPTEYAKHVFLAGFSLVTVVYAVYLVFACESED
ncbi:MAG TPA: hypothetical protein VGO35_11220 [Gammaproteobacteria bacterium]|jgi:hypothetical protein|nr:hypothetical protein [Gammaproteobacteria bacterium]